MLWICIFVGLAAAVWLYLSMVLRSSLYHPTAAIEATPADAGLSYEDLYLTTADGKKINAWYVPCDNAIGTVLAFHGNEGNISHRISTLAFFHLLGVNVLMVDYHGYGRSEGSVSERATYMDADAGWAYLTEQLKTPADKIVIFGRSLGGAVAADLASRRPEAAGLMVESTFYSIRDVVGYYVLIQGIKYLAWNYYPSAAKLQDLKMPLLVIHSPADDIIPYESGKKLYESAGSSDKEFFEIYGSHNGGWADSMDTYEPKIKEFLKKNLVSPEHKAN